MPEKVTKIVELLPEGLSESAIDQIADLFDQILSEEIKNSVQKLEVKTQAYIRANIDMLKDQARKELQLENDTARGNSLVEAVKSVFAFELGKDDSDSQVSKMLNEQTELTQQNDLLLDELTRLTEEKQKLRTVSKALSTEIGLLKKQLSQLKEENADLNSSLGEFNTSERGVVVSEELGRTSLKDDKDKVEKRMSFLEELGISEASMALMPSKKKKLED